MSKIDVDEARILKAEGLSLREIGRVFDATGEAVRLALQREPKENTKKELSFDSMPPWAARAAQALADEPHKNHIIENQARQLKVLKAILKKEEANNKKFQEMGRIFKKLARSSDNSKTDLSIDSNLTYHI